MCWHACSQYRTGTPLNDWTDPLTSLICPQAKNEAETSPRWGAFNSLLSSACFRFRVGRPSRSHDNFLVDHPCVLGKLRVTRLGAVSVERVSILSHTLSYIHTLVCALQSTFLTEIHANVEGEKGKGRKRLFPRLGRTRIALLSLVSFVNKKTHGTLGQRVCHIYT